MRPARSLWARPLLCAAVTAGTGLAVFLTGRSALPLPRGGTAPDLRRWWVATGWVVAVFALGRLAVLVAAIAMSLGFLFAALALASRDPGRSVWLAAVVGFPGGRLLARVALGVTASGVLLAACGAGSSAVSQGPTPGSSVVSPAASPGSPSAPPAAGPASPALTRTPGPGGPLPGVVPEPAPVLRNTATAPRPPVPNRGASGAPPPPTPASVPGRASAAGRVRARPAPSAGRAPAAGPPPAPAPTTWVGPPSAPGRRPPQAAGADPTLAPAALPAAGAPSDPAATGGTRASGEWRVRPGDSLWSIAEATAGSPDRVPGYWLRLIALNRSTLPFPDDPSLLFPGDILVLPPLQSDGP